MSKTASTTVYVATTEAATNPVFKVHLLRPEALVAVEQNYRETDPDARPRHLFHGLHLVRRTPTPAEPWLVVTMVREPIARAASEFFQSSVRLRSPAESESTDAFERFLRTDGLRTLSWFEQEFEPTIGVDVYATPFDTDVGYTTLEAPQAKVLVLRQESLDVAPRALGQFLGVDGDVAIGKENVGATKSYRDEYARLVRRVRLSPDVLDAAYSSRLVTHFYSPAEIAEFRRTWTPSDGEYDRPSTP